MGDPHKAKETHLADLREHGRKHLRGRIAEDHSRRVFAHIAADARVVADANDLPSANSKRSASRPASIGRRLP